MAYSKNDLFSPSVGFLSSFDVNTRQAIANVWPIADVINLLMPLLNRILRDFGNNNNPIKTFFDYDRI